MLLKNKWVKKKKYKFSFCGLITKNRKITIEKWLNSEINYSQEISINSFYNKIKKKVSNYIFHEMLFINYYGDLAVWSSSRGRKFPIKSWDMEYFNFMLKSEYVLCPSGDYVWTYRFFEAVMCGAIPIVEQSCDIYDGFKFYRMSDSRLSYTYNNDIIEYNFNLLLDRITLSDSEINLLKRQLNKLLKS